MRFFTVFLSTLAIALTAVADDAPPPKPWATSFGGGLAITSGNTDTRNINVSFSTKYDPKTRLIFKSDVLYLRGSDNGDKTVDKLTANAREEYSLSDRTFGFGEIGVLRDPFKNIDYLVAPIVGAGYRVIKSDLQNLTFDAGVGGQIEKNSVVGRSTSGAVKAGENYDYAFSKTGKFTQKLTGLWKMDDFADALYHFDAGLGATLAAHTELKVGYAYDYKAKPIPDTLKKGDSALFIAVLFKN